MATPPSSPRIILAGLARALVNQNLLTEEAATKAVDQANKSKTALSAFLVEQKLVAAKDIALVSAEAFGYPLFDITQLDLENAPLKIVSEDLIKKHRALPLLKRGRTLFVAIADPTNLRALDDIKFNCNLTVEPIVVLETALTADFIDKVLVGPDGSNSMEDDDTLGDLETTAGDDDPNKASGTVVGENKDDEVPIVRFVNGMLVKAITQGASDLHFEPYEKMYRVRFRQDGVLSEITKPPVAMASRISARLKVMASMDIAERRLPQDGRIKLHLSKKRAIDFRVNSLPTLFGEKVVLRILDPSSASLGIDMLGYEPIQKERYLSALHRPQGMILVTGPTGSGKTVSLYTGLNILNTEDVNISTAEDPVEINLPGINQVNVNPKTGMTFANALRAFLRQDPDVIMVGEIRDLETAEIAIKAAQTGHMVMSTLHTNSAPQTLTRLLNMGVAPYNIASSVSLIIAQRLARRLCPHCKTVAEVPPEELIRQGFLPEELATLVVYRPVGCDQCKGGYKGRLGIYEVMPISNDIGRLIMAGGNAIQIADLAQKEGINSIRQSGLNKIRMGLTSLEEINRVTKE